MKKSKAESFDAAVARLGGLSEDAYESVRVDTAAKFKVRTRVLDRAVDRWRAKNGKKPPIGVVANARNASDDNWSVQLAFATRGGERKKALIPYAKLCSVKDDAWYTDLLDLGFVPDPDPAALPKLRSYLIAQSNEFKDKTFLTTTDRVGWADASYLLPEESFGQKTSVLAQLTGEYSYKASGTLDEWRRNIASLCLGNARLIFAVSLAFVGPLLLPCGAEGGGFHFEGKSTTGKTTALRVAASAWGPGDGPSSFMCRWRATHNALENVALAHNDTFLVLDEINQAEPRAVYDAAYLLANGQGKARMRSDGTPRPVKTWRVNFLSSGEVPLETKISEDGKRIMSAGQKVRIIDIPADVGAGFGVFADLKGRPDAKSFADELIDASARYHGVASREFLSKLVADVPGAIESVRRSRIAFNSANVADGVDGQVQRVGDRFALVAAAGELAIEFGILPWPVGTAAEAAASCYQAWLGKRGDTGPAELAAGVTQIYKFIERDGMSRFQDILESSGTGVESTNRTVINRLGFRQQNKDKRWEYFVLPEQWVSEMCRGFDPKAIADEMIRLGVLIPDKKGGQRADVKKLPNQAGEMKVRRCYHLSADILVSPELLRENDSNKKRKFEK